MGFQFVMKGEQRKSMDSGRESVDSGRESAVMAVMQRLENGQSQKNKVVLD